MLDYVLTGCAALFIDGTSQVLIAGVKGWKARAVESPRLRPSCVDPGCFHETLRTSTALIRRRIKTPCLRFETLNIGRITRPKSAWSISTVSPTRP